MPNLEADKWPSVERHRLYIHAFTRKTIRDDLEMFTAAELYCGAGMLRRTKPVLA